MYCSVVKNLIMRNYGIYAYLCLPSLLTRPSRRYKSQYVSYLVFSWYQSWRGPYVLILPILIYEIHIIQSSFAGLGFAQLTNIYFSLYCLVTSNISHFFPLVWHTLRTEEYYLIVLIILDEAHI